MLERVEARLDLKPERPVGDTAYGRVPMLGWLVEEKHIAPHVPVWDKNQCRDGTFSSHEFEWEGEADQYRCPAGKALRPRQKHYKNRPSRVTKDNTIIYATGKADCRDCRLKSRCCRTHRFAKSDAVSTKMRATWPALSSRLPTTTGHAMIEIRSRCYLPISSAFCDSIGCAGSAGRTTNSGWPPPLRISGNWPCCEGKGCLVARPVRPLDAKSSCLTPEHHHRTSMMEKKIDLSV